MVEIKNKNLSLVKMNKNKNFLTRQSSPKVYEMNASIYLWKKQIIGKFISFILDSHFFFLSFPGVYIGLCYR